MEGAREVVILEGTSLATELPKLSDCVVACNEPARVPAVLKKPHDVLETYPLDEDTASFPKGPFLFRVTGDGMEPTVRRGEHVVVEGGRDFGADGIYLFRLGLDYVSIGRVMREPRGLKVFFDNRHCAAFTVDPDSPGAFAIIGPVTWHLRRTF